mmetsp:Transcript_99152/g.319700  ORF Transcript_99152/g.319700 Transcript_99152/m.319700 type:complete len:251 (+) Transcript_99152:762-1514(+)
MFGVMVLSAVNMMYFWDFTVTYCQPSSLAAAVKGTPTCMGPSFLGGQGSSFSSFKVAKSGPTISERRAAWTWGKAPSLLPTAAAATSLSALNFSGMYCTANPFLLATTSIKSLLARISSEACRRAAGSLVTTSSTKRSSARSGSAAPWRAAPLPRLAAVRTSSRSLRSSSEAPFRAEPSPAVMTSSTKSRSDLRVSAAASKASPLMHAARMTSAVSALRLSAAKCNAMPRLCSTAVKRSSLSMRTSSGAL